MQRVEHVDFEKKLIPNMVTVERYAFDECNMRNEGRLAIIHVAAVAHCKCMIDGQMETMNIGCHYQQISGAHGRSSKVLTIIFFQAPIVFNVQIRECAMDMGANLLSCLGRAENPNHRDTGPCPFLPLSIAIRKLRIKIRWGCLVVVDTVESDAKQIHGNLRWRELEEQTSSVRIVKQRKEAKQWRCSVEQFVKYKE